MGNQEEQKTKSWDMGSIPEVLKKQNRWVCHNSKKEPINAKTGGLASATNKSSWSSFVEAVTGMQKHNLPGLGFMLGDGFVGVDIDGCALNGEICQGAKEVIDKFQSYAEFSPSGTGIHIICKGKKPGNKCKAKLLPGAKAVELYDKDRYFTVTGNVIKDLGIEERTSEIDWLYNQYFGKPEKEKAKPKNKTIPNDREESITSLAIGFEKDEKLKAFYEGDFITQDESAKDMALMGKLLYWTSNDDELAIETFMDSPFVAGKDEAHQKKLERADYIERTINAVRPSTTAWDDHVRFVLNHIGSVPSGGMEKLSAMKPHEKYSFDDRGNGDLFADFFKDVVRFNATAGEWYFYTGRVWKRDDNGMRVARRAKELKDLLSAYSLTITGKKKKEVYKKHVGKLGARSVRDAMLKDARDKYCFENVDLNKNEALLNCVNGTINLETFEFKKHSGEDLLSQIARVWYDPNAKAPLWDKFISDIMMGDQEKIRYLQKAIGYGITTDTSLETCFILYGASTRNGKSTLMETLMHMLGGSGGYSLQMKPETLAQRQNSDSRVASGDIARLQGARLLNVSEPPKKMIFDVALLKTLLGRDSIVARHLREREFEFTPVFKLFMNTNFLPIIYDDTIFASGRLNVITFDRQFTEAEQDKNLKDKLKEKESLSGIFNWCLDGLRAYREEGLEAPSKVCQATAEYRQESDKLGKFMNECLEVSETNMTAGVMYTVYEAWCRACGYGCENQGNFFAELKAKNLLFKSGTVEGKTKARVIRGYRINGDWKHIVTGFL